MSDNESVSDADRFVAVARESDLNGVRFAAPQDMQGPASATVTGDPRKAATWSDRETAEAWAKVRGHRVVSIEEAWAMIRATPLPQATTGSRKRSTRQRRRTQEDKIVTEPFDPDKQQETIDQIGPASFGRLVAQVIVKKPTSQNWALVNQAIEKLTGWDADHEHVQALVNRIASEETQ